MTFERIFAQPSAVRVLSHAAETGRLANAYLFEGPSGVGKSMSAIALGRAMLCTTKPGKGCGECDPCRRAGLENHPDLRFFRPRDEGNRNIQVETLRQDILPIAQFAPFEGPHAFLVFPDAELSFPEVHPESANALLKTLEEPRRAVTFILTSERPERLLPTIRSRCQSVRFSRLPPRLLERILEGHGVPEERRAAAVALADGRADRAIALAEEGAAEALLDAALRIDRGVDSRKPGVLVDIAEDLARDANLELALETLATLYRDVAALGLGLPESELVFRHRAADVRERALVLDPARASARVELIVDTIDWFERNSNRQIALDSLFFQLRDAR